MRQRARLNGRRLLGAWHRMRRRPAAAASPPFRPLINRDDLASRVHVAQMDYLAQITPGSSLVSVAAAILLASIFWRNAPHGFLIGFVAMLAVTCCASCGYTVAWRARSRPIALSAAAMWPRISLSALSGLSWASAPLVLVPYGAENQRLLIGYVCAGLIAAGPMLAPVLMAALLFSGVIFVGASISLLAVHGPLVHSLAWLFLGYGALMAYSTFNLNHRFTDRVIANVQLEEQSDIIALLLRDFEESSSNCLWQTDARCRLVNVSPRVAEAVGVPRHVLEGLDLLAWSRVGQRRRGREHASFARLAAALGGPEPFRDVELPIVVEGERRWLSLTGKPVFGRDGGFVGFRGVGADVTGARLRDERIVYLATIDGLTDLPNRVTLNDALRRACDGGQPFALLYLDLDQFKAINDTLGHSAGDSLLIAAGRRMRQVLGPGDLLARLGGDEFAVLHLPGDGVTAERLGSRLADGLAAPFTIDEVQTSVGVSVGIALAPADGAAPEALSKAADLALYQAKRDGRGTLRFFDTEMSRLAQARSALQADLHQALARDELTLHFQPILDLASGRIVTFEALLRWQHSLRGAIDPAEFIPLAEEGGLIVKLGAWALRAACAAAAGWEPSVRVAVNLSTVQVRNPGLLAEIDAALSCASLAAERLELEITESLFLEATDATRACLHALRGRGIRIALDDFGTGYSSLSYLRSFPFDKVKIDRSFVRDLVTDPSAGAIVQAIATMAESLGMVIAAEGIETPEQEDILRACGCAQVQGFLYGRPLPRAAIDRLLAPQTANHAIFTPAGA